MVLIADTKENRNLLRVDRRDGVRRRQGERQVLLDRLIGTSGCGRDRLLLSVTFFAALVISRFSGSGFRSSSGLCLGRDSGVSHLEFLEQRKVLLREGGQPREEQLDHVRQRKLGGLAEKVAQSSLRMEIKKIKSKFLNIFF